MKDSCQGTKDFVSWQKIGDLQIFLMPLLEFGNIKFCEIILVGEKKLFTLEMASCWQIFFANRAIMAKSWAWYMWLVELIANFITTKPKGKQ